MAKLPLVIAWFEEVRKKDIPLVGGKGANLGEMTQAQIPVPPGFIVTADAYYYFLKKSGLIERIRQTLGPLDVGDSLKLQQVASDIKQAISTAPMPPEIAAEIKKAYRKLGGMVAVRSSATAEDLPEASFAGQQRTFLNITGEDEVVSAVQACWASLFEPRAIFYRKQQGFDHLKVRIAVPVQRMVQSEVSGVMFTLDPVTSDRSKIIIEAVWGLGEAIVSGEVTPDIYVVDKEETKLLNMEVAPQEWQLVRNLQASRQMENAIIKVPVNKNDSARQKLTEAEVLAIARLGKKLETLYQFPQDIEWAKEGKEVYIVQTRPVTAIKSPREAVEAKELEATPIITGAAASPGMAAGPVKIVYRATEIDKVKPGDVLVAEMTTPDFVPAMKRAVAIVTDKGGRTAHAAIVSRELGIPCVVGTKTATKDLSDDQIITVDGHHGKVYNGRLVTATVSAPTAAPRAHVATQTRVYVNLAEPELAEKIASRDVDGVGLLRAEFIIAQIGEHPRHIIAQGKQSEFVDKLAQGLTIFARAFNPRPVVYRTTDFKTNEYRNLRGGEAYEDTEENPMLGYRGCSRYIKELDVFKLEIEAIKKVRESYKNLWIMFPFVRTVKELTETKKLLEAEGLRRSKDFKLWMMVEVPSNVILMDKFLDVGIDGISIGSNDLTQLILGIDRDNPKLAEEFDERDEAVLIALEQAIKTCVRRGVTSSICGQAPSVYPELTYKLVKWGITSVSVSPDMIDRTRDIIAEAEGRLSSLSGPR